MKVVTIIGARPQFIKASPVSKALKKVGIQEVMIHTGQHFDKNMSEIFFTEMKIQTPQYNLNIHGGTHATMTGKMLVAIEEVLLKESPQAVLVYGDTNSTLAGSLAASKLHIPLAHVESGLRSFNQQMPEEINRIITDRLSSLLFCPTQTAIDNLSREGMDARNKTIEATGDVMYDALLQFRDLANQSRGLLDTAIDPSRPFILATVHRQENTEDPQRLKSIWNALSKISEETSIIFPVHPRTRNKISTLECPENIILIDPVGYLDMIRLLDHCSMVITDSGGLQKEAYFTGKFCITCRDETEWVELVDHGYNTLCGATEDAILSAYTDLKNRAFVNKHSFYGKGNAAEEIALSLRKFLET